VRFTSGGEVALRRAFSLPGERPIVR
jgi:hypothetical protein